MLKRSNGPPDWSFGITNVNMGFFATVYELHETLDDWFGERIIGRGGYGV
jgi:hypothetical protein